MKEKYVNIFSFNNKANKWQYKGSLIVSKPPKSIIMVDSHELFVFSTKKPELSRGNFCKDPMEYL